jgi:FG-GAP-like repeat
VAGPNGLADMGFVKGVAWGDFNNDGRSDLFVSVKGGAKHLFRNDGPMDPRNPRADRWKFTDLTAQAGVTEPSHSFATWFFDYDNDGWPDLFVAGFQADTLNDIGAFQLGLPYEAEVPRLYHNNHDGTFTDVTKPMRLERAILVMGANFGDLDDDGWLDVYLGTGDVPCESLLPTACFATTKARFLRMSPRREILGICGKGMPSPSGTSTTTATKMCLKRYGGSCQRGQLS